MSFSYYKGIWEQFRESINKVIEVNLNVTLNAQKIASGDLTVELAARSINDELLVALNNMVLRLREVVSQINSAANNVAAEVRKLAEVSSVAAKESNELTKQSVEIAQNSGKLFSQIVPNVQRTATHVQEIAAASNEQN